MPAIYARANFGVLCSTAEGMSNAVMEGMAAGLPMVVTAVGGNPELVPDGERGLVVPPQRPAASCAEAFRRLLADPERARRMGPDGAGLRGAGAVPGAPGAPARRAVPAGGARRVKSHSDRRNSVAEKGDD